MLHYQRVFREATTIWRPFSQRKGKRLHNSYQMNNQYTNHSPSEGDVHRDQIPRLNTYRSMTCCNHKNSCEQYCLHSHFVHQHVNRIPSIYPWFFLLKSLFVLLESTLVFSANPVIEVFCLNITFQLLLLLLLDCCCWIVVGLLYDC